MAWWALQPLAFIQRVILDAGGTLPPTTGAGTQGMDIAYDGRWGYRPALAQFAATTLAFPGSEPGQHPP